MWQPGTSDVCCSRAAAASASPSGSWWCSLMSHGIELRLFLAAVWTTVTFFWALWALFIPVKLHSSLSPTVILTGLELCSLVWPSTTILLPHFLKNWDYRPASCTWLSRPLNKYLTLKTRVYPGHTQRVCHSGVPSSALRHRFDVSSQRAPKTEGCFAFLCFDLSYLISLRVVC